MNNPFDSATFNQPVYKQILDLAKNKQIATWYDLLGVPPFEADEAVLDRAMVQRFSLVRRYQVGNYEQQALALIDELSRAYACLTSDDTRSAYDAMLRAAATDILPRKPLKRAQRLSEEPTETDPNVCPQCGKPTSPKAPACYQCGHKKQTVLERRSHTDVRSKAADAGSMRELVSQDLSPEQLLSRLKEARKLIAAGKRAIGTWKPPKELQQMAGREPRSRCHRCGRGLMQQTEAHAFSQEEVRQTAEFIQNFAKQLQSLGKAEFEWPLSEADIRRAQQQLPDSNANLLILFCHGCTLRILRSPRVG